MAWILERSMPMCFFEMRNEDGDAETIFKKTEVWRNLNTGKIEYKNIFFSKITWSSCDCPLWSGDQISLKSLQKSSKVFNINWLKDNNVPC